LSRNLLPKLLLPCNLRSVLSLYSNTYFRKIKLLMTFQKFCK
jgi:hypothetical protein